QIASLQEAVRKTELLMRYSSTNYLEVLITQQNLLNARQTEVVDYFEEIQGIINLYHALGGG
ncbi:MAG: TolC family protein, partial [Phocaeicola sp.]